MEFLASHGYIVVASPSWGGTGLIKADRYDLEEQARDIEFLIGFGRTLQGAAPTGVGLIGFSWGGISNVVVAARNAAVGALVSLDGSIRYFHQRDFTQHALATRQPYATPSLFIDQGANTDTAFFRRANADTGNTFFESIRYADRYRVLMKKIDHQNLVALFNRFSGPQPVNFVSDTAITNRAYEQMARLTLQFLNGYLKNDSAGVEAVRTGPAIAGSSATDVVVVSRRAQRPLPNVTSFAAAARGIGLVRAPELLKQIRVNDPAYSISEADLDQWAWSLSGAEGLGVFKMIAEMYPTSPSAHSNLGDAYLATGDTARAIVSFERVLQLDAQRGYARSMLQRLKRSMSVGHVYDSRAQKSLAEIARGRLTFAGGAPLTKG